MFHDAKKYLLIQLGYKKAKFAIKGAKDE